MVRCQIKSEKSVDCIWHDSKSMETQTYNNEDQTYNINANPVYCYNTEFHTGYEKKKTSIIHKQMSENQPLSMVARQNHK